MKSRTAHISRETAETNIEINLGLDGSGQGMNKIGIPFMEHMLDQVRKHGCFDLDIKAQGDLEVDFHHTVEDTGITLGQCFNKALGEQKRYLSLWACLCAFGRGIVAGSDRFFRTPRAYLQG